MPVSKGHVRKAVGTGVGKTTGRATSGTAKKYENGLFLAKQGTKWKAEDLAFLWANQHQANKSYKEVQKTLLRSCQALRLKVLHSRRAEDAKEPVVTVSDPVLAAGVHAAEPTAAVPDSAEPAGGHMGGHCAADRDIAFATASEYTKDLLAAAEMLLSLGGSAAAPRPTTYTARRAQHDPMSIDYLIVEGEKVERRFAAGRR